MEPIFIVILIFFAVFFGTAIFIAVNVIKADKSKREQNAKSSDSYRAHSSSESTSSSGMTDEQRRRLDYLREQQRQRTVGDKHAAHVKDAGEHAHVGDEEHYEEIVGSLGEVNDEGCRDLSGVRFIVHDLAYDTTDDGERDYTELAKAIVIGEIINSPRFRKPHRWGK